MAQAEGEIVHQAQRLTFSQLCTYLDYWLLAVDPDGAELPTTNARSAGG